MDDPTGTEPLSPEALHALNAERLRQWAEQLSDAGASALVVLGVDETSGKVTVLWPEGAAPGDVIEVLLKGASLVAAQKTMS